MSHRDVPPDLVDLAAEPAGAEVILLADRRVRLHKGNATADADLEALAERVDADGLVLRDPGDLELGRYVWLDVDVADDGEPVRALGEVLPRRDPTSVALDIKFKHLFPDQRRRLLRALEAGRG